MFFDQNINGVPGIFQAYTPDSGFQTKNEA
jgi:hypothetical protein